MSTQASLSRICLRCRLKLSSAYFGPSMARKTAATTSNWQSSPPGTWRKYAVSRGVRAIHTRSYSTTKSAPDEAEEGKESVGGTEENEPGQEETSHEPPPGSEENVSEPSEPARKAFEKKGPQISKLEKFLTEIKARKKPGAKKVILSSEVNDKVFEKYQEICSATGEEFGLGEAGGWEVGRAERVHDADSPTVPPVPPELENVASKFDFPSATHSVQDIDISLDGETVTLHGFVKSPRTASKALTFLNLYDYYSGPEKSIQVVSYIDDSSPETLKEIHKSLVSIHPLVPVAVTGKITKTKDKPPKGASAEEKQAANENPIYRPELQLLSLISLNSVSKEIIYTPETVFPPSERHLQLRTSQSLFSTLRVRAKAASICRDQLESTGFLEVETPLLFKSTPEGAREFLVPARGGDNICSMFYALPQSPQQYKQILMASGVPRYYQLAKCFRDEDLRADRQPEFTQLDLEMSFASGKDVMDIIEQLLKRLWKEVLGVELEAKFKRMSWMDSMLAYGTDKPDLRFPERILQVNHILERFVGRKEYMEAFNLRCEDKTSLEKIEDLHQQFRSEFMGRDEDAFISYIAGEKTTAEGVTEGGLRPYDVGEINERLSIQPNDIVVVQKRAGHLAGGNTKLGLLRTAFINKAISLDLLKEPSGFEFVWITDFPLFSPYTSGEPGQSGTAGLTSTHHPFTAPLVEDMGFLDTFPKRVRADHYDIVVNGVELGGGSRRIHDAQLQKYILQSILKVHVSRSHEFDHLLKVLDSGCPPHAGIALGFDRLCAILCGTKSIRDVIAFPKNAQGEDTLVRSPGPVSDRQLAEYPALRRERRKSRFDPRREVGLLEAVARSSARRKTEAKEEDAVGVSRPLRLRRVRSSTKTSDSLAHPPTGTTDAAVSVGRSRTSRRKVEATEDNLIGVSQPLRSRRASSLSRIPGSIGSKYLAGPLEGGNIDEEALTSRLRAQKRRAIKRLREDLSAEKPKFTGEHWRPFSRKGDS